MHSIDHIILGVHDLEAGMEEFQAQTGVRPVFGGEHPAFGTHNALVSLGDKTYLEILAPRPNTEVVDWLQFLSNTPSIKPVMWVIACDNIYETAEILSGEGIATTEPAPGSRKTANGSMLEWLMMKPQDDDLATSFFFIEWNRTSLHPSETSPKGCHSLRLAIAAPFSNDLEVLVEALQLDVAVQHSNTHAISMSLGTEKGPLRLG